MAAYNGWPLHGEARGGHIGGAIACPLSWMEKYDRDGLEQYLAARGITPETNIVTYGYDSDDSAIMVSKLAKLGYTKARGI